MWNRKELKARAKVAFKRNYWYCVLVALLLALVVGSLASATSNQPDADTGAKIQISIAYGTAASLLIARVLALNPLVVGGRKFFADNARGDAPLNDLTVGFSGNYIRNVLGMLLRDLFIALWTLLFVVPGIIKAYSYRMVPYILADDPAIDAKAAIDLSRKMMHGHKWNAFVLDLSFIGWQILNAFTCGLLGLFYVNPYVHATEAELYLALKGSN